MSRTQFIIDTLFYDFIAGDTVINTVASQQEGRGFDSRGRALCALPVPVWVLSSQPRLLSLSTDMHIRLAGKIVQVGV